MELELNIPEWLNEEFLRNLLETNQDEGAEKYKVEIVKHEVVKRVAKGTNYLSNLLGVNIDYNKVSQNATVADSVQLVVKAPLGQSDGLSGLNCAGVVQREVEAYYELLPKIDAVIVKAGDESIVPKCYKCDVEEVVILEDLKVSGYSLLDKTKQMDYETTMTTLKYIAKFHAASVKVHEDNPKLVERHGRQLIYTDPLDPGVKATLEPILGEERYELLCTEFAKHPESQKYVRLLSNMKPKVWDLYVSLQGRDDAEFSVINHGDVHSNNMLLLYDEQNNIKNIKFVDYQLLRYTSPALDMYYFMATSVKYEVAVGKFNEISTAYHRYLNHYLEKYGCEKRLDWNTFQRAIDQYELFHLMVVIFCLAFMFSGYEETLGNGEAIKHEYPFSQYVKVEKYRKAVVSYMDYYSDRPWFQNLYN